MLSYAIWRNTSYCHSHTNLVPYEALCLVLLRQIQIFDHETLENPFVVFRAFCFLYNFQSVKVASILLP